MPKLYEYTAKIFDKHDKEFSKKLRTLLDKETPEEASTSRAKPGEGGLLPSPPTKKEVEK